MIGSIELLWTLLAIFVLLFIVGLAVMILSVGFGFIARLLGRVAACALGIFGDAVTIAANLLVSPFSLARALVMLVIGRFREADASAQAFQDRLVEVGRRVWSAVVQRPLRTVGVRVPPHGRGLGPAVAIASTANSEAPAAAAGRVIPAPPRGASSGQPPPPWPVPSAIAGGFPGYQIETRLPSGGSGARLYAAVPDPTKQASLPGSPARVVIKSFAIGEGSTLPQIIRESRSLDAAKSLGLVIDHALEPHRFWYAMPHYEGPTLTALTNARHRACGPSGLDSTSQRELVAIVTDVVEGLATFHRAGLWHKDVKPDNIIVSNGRAHLIDVGLVTPLASSFTLTTHGTEYFRDPEMVRQALRGAKVHQVDGAKFDIYSAGAVLYAILENTFPAHGPLSRFEKPSPEALRWIIRRAMADYQQRYASAEEMLGDLRFVLMSGNMHTVRPADLPSMRGASMADAAAQIRPAGVRCGPDITKHSQACATRSRGSSGWSGFSTRRDGEGSKGSGAAWSPWITAALAVVLISVAVAKSGRFVERGWSVPQETATDEFTGINWKGSASNNRRATAGESVARAASSGSSAASAALVACSEIPSGRGPVLVQCSRMLAAGLPESAERKALASIGSKGWTPVVNDPEAFAALALLEGHDPELVRAELAKRGYRGIVRFEPNGRIVEVSLESVTDR